MEMENKDQALEQELELHLSSKQGLKKKRSLNDWFAYFFLVLVGITMIVPFLWMISTSLKDPSAVFTYPPRWLPSETIYYLGDQEAGIEISIVDTLPNGDLKIRILKTREMLVVAPDAITSKWRLNVKWENYPKAWKSIKFGRGYLNTIFIALMVTIGQVLTSSMAAYAFARLQFPFRDKLFLAYLATMMIPRDVTMIPVFILLKKLPELLNMLLATDFFSCDIYTLGGGSYLGKPVGIDSYFALIMPGCFSAYGTFMLRQFFMGIPVDLEDAAKIDGCSLLGIYGRIILPLSKPALATLTTFTFMGSWRDFMWPLIIANSRELMPLQILLQSFQGFHNTEWTLLMAGSIIVLFPVIVVFLFNQRFFIEGIQLGAVKG